MDAVLILQIITITISAASVFLNVLITKTENAKQNRLDIITKQRIVNMNFLREKSALFLSFLAPVVLKEAANGGALDFKQDFSKAASDIKCQLKTCYKNEKDIIGTVEEAESEVERFLSEKSEDSLGEIKSLSKEFYQKISAYNLADWRFIKKQASGADMGSDEFEKIYAEILNEF